ncbi:MAG: Bug family tripartite tricarboxylate transporter substrate binding protein [Betaproteobacteria bacterium]|jgi:tripartite-type tricarboxylate transporter receptor subunit TctC|nr:tripartite tricarboxylate transporter substrate binding protein [Betaproteobacteria bacterium]
MNGFMRSAAGILLMLSATAIFAQEYPNRPIRFIVPFPPGGGTDTVARLIAGPLSERLKQQVIIDNRSGANAIIGTELGARAPADGYTWVYCLPASVSVNPTLYRGLSYEPLRDFSPVIQLNSIALLLVVNNSLPVKTVPELIALAKARPGQLNYASSGNGSAAHLAMALFSVMAGVSMVHVPYKGGAPAMTDLISGQVQIMSGPMIGAMPHVKSGKVRAIAVTTAKRAQGLPEIPAIGETLKGYESSIWHGVLMPKGAPAAVVRRVNAELNGVLQVAEVRERMATQGADPVGGTAEAFAAMLKADIARQSDLLRQIGLAGSASQ